MSPKRPRDESDRLPGAVWLREPRRSSRAAPSLSRERIVEAAVAALDGGGAAALSMRKLADALDVHATSLYWHVPHRDDLLDLALDAVFGEVALPAEHAEHAEHAAHAESWREDVALFMRELRAALLRHPWAAGLAGTRPLMGPNALARSEFVHAALVTAGFDGIGLTTAAAMVSHYVIGSVSTQTAWPPGGADARARDALRAHLRDAADRYPTLAAHPAPPHSDWDAHFARGVDLLLDGFATGRHHPGV